MKKSLSSVLNIVRKRKTIFFCAFVLCMLLPLVMPTCLAMDCGFSAAEVDAETAATIFARMNFETIEEPQHYFGFCCFDIRDDGSYALAFDNATNEGKHILVYDSKGSYLYGISFDIRGSFAFEWLEDNLIIYTQASKRAICVDSNADMVGIYTLDEQFMRDPYYDEVTAATKKVNDKTYRATTLFGSPETDFFAKLCLSFSELSVEDANGEAVVLCDYTSNSVILLIACTLVLCLFVAFFFIKVILPLIRSAKSNTKKKDTL